MLQLFIRYFLIKVNNIPENLRKIIEKREDLMALDFLEKYKERDLVVWLILHGFKEYPELPKGNVNNNSILNWLSLGASIKKFNNIPKIIVGIWDIYSSQKNRWPFPELNHFYLVWVESNWENFKLDLPKFENLFNRKINLVNKLEIFIFDIFWLIRKPFSIRSKKYFGITIDYFIADKFKGWQIQINVINALVYRELKTRVSQVRFGVMGVFIEPLGVMSVFLVIFSVLRADSGPLDIVLFLGAGIVLFTLFQDIAIRSSNGITANEALFFYRPVKPIDTVIARTIVESGLYGIVFIVIISATFLIRQEIVLDDVALLLSTYLALVIFSFGVGLFLLVVTFIYPSVIQLIPLAMRPLWFLSGVFISLSAIPQWLRPYLSWNPIFQALELARYSFTNNYIIDKNMVSFNYLWACSLLSFTFGLCVYTFNEKKLLTR